MAAGPTQDDPLLVLTNRLPFAIQRTGDGFERRHAAGGLASALEPVLRKRGGTWIGWPGIELRRGEQLDLRGAPYRICPVPLSENEIARYYHGLSNRLLWPMLHSLVERASFDRRAWSVYREVNKRFAHLALAHIERETDLVWVHDYHLMLTPQYLRRRLSKARIAFFLHVPFPPFDVFRAIPWARELLRGLLACDLVGFHTDSYARNFLDCVEQLMRVEVDHEARRVRSDGHETRVGAFPIGIDYDAFESRAPHDSAAPPPRVRTIVGADRLDYTKGIPQRILAFERLLEKHPEHRERVVLLQIAVPSRNQVSEYRALKREIEELVGRVNGRFGTSTWSPIQYLYRTLDPDRLAVLYRDADVALVTPLRDGMNLVAKEFVACQTADPGVLVLSRLAGAAETMREALLVNPYDLERTADQLQRALVMPEAERRSRLDALQERERANDVNAWVASFLEAAAPQA
ncbi:MAG: trehalose-6-phosphate synthase [Myxococcales bacterium]|nr:trehalose-6-phosphate synthase [Myxococcales bacterium]